MYSFWSQFIHKSFSAWPTIRMHWIWILPWQVTTLDVHEQKKNTCFDTVPAYQRSYCTILSAVVTSCSCWSVVLVSRLALTIKDSIIWPCHLITCHTYTKRLQIMFVIDKNNMIKLSFFLIYIFMIPAQCPSSLFQSTKFRN